jgi:hypothetical protein
MSGAGTANASLPPASDSAQAARAHVEEPVEETTSRAQGALTAALNEQPAPSPEIEQLCDDIQDAIENRRPVDEDSLRRTDPEAQAQAVGTALNADITSESEAAAGDYEGVNAPPEGSPEQVSAPLPDTPTSVPTPAVNAGQAAPPAVPAEDVSLEADVAANQSRIEEAGMDNEVTSLIETGPVADARAATGELQEVAARDPAEVLREQEEAIAGSEEAMREVENRALAALEASRSGTVAETFSEQLAMAGSEEQQRVAAATAAETIYTTARDAVNDQLEPMVTTAMEMWNTGKDLIATAFDNELQEAKRMVDERHEGIDGAIVSIWDDVAGLPDYITDIYTRAERTFGRDICALIRRVSTYVNGIVLACEEIIDNADRQIETIFSQLPESLQGWASEQQAGFDQQLNGLRDNVHDTQQNFTDDLVAQAGDAVQEARERIDALREAAKGALQKAADAITEFINDPVRFTINGLLAMVGIAPPAFWALLARIEQAAQDIADDPLGFGNNLLAALRLGFDNFFGNFFGHLLSGFINWLFSAMGTVGVELPPDTSLKSIITFFLQVMGITWPNIRIILVRHVGERNVELLEKAYELITLLIEEGPGGIFEMIKERLDPAEMMNTIIEAAVSYMVEAIVSIATVRIIGLFNPAGAIFQAIEAIYKVLKWVFENAARIFTLVETVVNGIADIIAGNIAGMAEKTERALAGMLVPVIDFVAGFLGLGDLPEKIAEVVGGFQAMVLSAIDRAIGFLVERARGLLQSLGIGGGDAGAEDTGEDEEVGKSISFSADGESHRSWIDDTGSRPKVMVASRTETLEEKVRRWNTEVDEPRHAENKSQILTILPAVNRLLGITEEEAVEARAADRAEDQNSTPETRAEAQTQDDEVEASQDALIPLLRQLFELFGEEASLIVLYADDLQRMDTMAQPTTAAQVVAKEDRQYAEFKDSQDWSGLRDLLLTGAGEVKQLHLSPLGTDPGGGDGDFQRRNFQHVFLAGLQLALPAARASRSRPATDEQLMGPGETPRSFALARRRTVHRREAPEGETGAVALAAPLKTELQRLLVSGGALNTAVGRAQNYFAETLKLSLAHKEYKVDPPPRPRMENSKVVIDYAYGSAADPAQKQFTVEVGLEDINGSMFDHTIIGSYLVAKPANTRGQITVTTEEGGQVEGPSTRIRLERSHLIADWLQGTGYREGLNIIHTSRDFNQQNMRNTEIELVRNLTNQQNAHEGQFVHMTLMVHARYELADHQQTANQVRDLITEANASELVDRRQEIADELYQILAGRQAVRIVDTITYDADIFLEDTLLQVIPTLSIGPDEFREEALS